LFKRNIYNEGTAVLLLTMVLILLKVFILSYYGPPSTGRIQQLVSDTSHKQSATKLLNHLTSTY